MIPEMDAAQRLLTELCARHGCADDVLARLDALRDKGADTIELPRIVDTETISPASTGRHHRR
jgi:hypothetical protein